MRYQRTKLFLLWLRFRAWLRGTSLAHLSDEEMRTRIACENIRAMARAYGYDVSELTDAVIIERTKRIGQLVASAGVTMAEAGNQIAITFKD